MSPAVLDDTSDTSRGKLLATYILHCLSCFPTPSWKARLPGHEPPPGPPGKFNFEFYAEARSLELLCLRHETSIEEHRTARYPQGRSNQTLQRVGSSRVTCLVFVGGKWREYSDTFLLCNTTCNSQDAAVSALIAKRVQPPSHPLHRKICVSAQLCLSAPLFVGQASAITPFALATPSVANLHRQGELLQPQPRMPRARRLRRHLGTG